MIITHDEFVLRTINCTKAPKRAEAFSCVCEMVWFAFATLRKHAKKPFFTTVRTLARINMAEGTIKFFPTLNNKDQRPWLQLDCIEGN